MIPVFLLNGAFNYIASYTVIRLHEIRKEDVELSREYICQKFAKEVLFAD